MISSRHATTTDKTNLVRQDLVEDLLDLLGAKVSPVSFSELDARRGGKDARLVLSRSKLRDRRRSTPGQRRQETLRCCY